MPVISLQANLSTDDLIRAVEQLTPGELDTILRHVLTLRARLQAQLLSEAETILVQRINQGLAREQRDLYQALIDRRDARTLTPEEHEELLRLTDQVEQFEANRAAALVELAQLRHTPVDSLLRELGIRPAGHG